LLLILFVSTCVAAGSDTQLWTTIYTTTALNRYVDFLANSQLRFGSDISDLVREDVQTGFNFRVCPYFTLSPTYSYINHEPSEGSHSTEDRLDLAATFQLPVGEWRVVITNMPEWRFREPQGDSFRYRPRLTLEHSIGPKPWQLTGYVSDEGFWDSDYREWVRNRYYVGFKKNLIPTVKLDVYYMQQNDGYCSPGDLFVIGCALRFYFRGAEREYRPDEIMK